MYISELSTKMSKENLLYEWTWTTNLFLLEKSRQHYVFFPGLYSNGMNPHFQQMILQRFAPFGFHVLHPCACCSQIRIWIFCYKCCTYIPFCNIAGYAQSKQYLMENLVHNLTQKKNVFLWDFIISIQNFLLKWMKLGISITVFRDNISFF